MSAPKPVPTPRGPSQPDHRPDPPDTAPPTAPAGAGTDPNCPPPGEAGGALPRPGRHRSRRLARPPDPPRPPLTAAQRLLILDAWRRSGLPAGDFAPLVGVSRHTLYAWKKRFDAHGPAGLEDQSRGAPSGSRLPEVTRRAILMMKEDNPDWGVGCCGGPTCSPSFQADDESFPFSCCHFGLRRNGTGRCRGVARPESS